jgi:hypothetical protein
MRSHTWSARAAGLGLACAALAAMPPRPAEKKAGPTRMAAASLLSEEVAIRKGLRQEVERTIEQTMAHLHSATQGAWDELGPPRCEGWLREKLIDWRVNTEFLDLMRAQALAAYAKAARLNQPRMRQFTLQKVYGELEQVQDRTDKVVIQELQAHSDRTRELQTERARLQGRLADAALAGAARAQAQRDLQANQNLLVETTKSYQHALGFAKAGSWRAWRRSLAVLPRGVAPGEPAPFALPAGLVPPAAELPAGPSSSAAPAIQFLQVRDQLGQPAVGELPGATVPLALPAQPPAKVRTQMRKLQLDALARMDPGGPARPMGRAAEALETKLVRMDAVAQDERRREAERARLQAEQVERAGKEAEQERADEEREDTLRQERHADRLLRRQAAREQRERELKEREANLATEREREAAAAQRQLEQDALERQEAEIEAAAARLERHHQAALARRAAAPAEPEAAPAPAPEADPAGASRPRITAIHWSRRAEKQRDELDWRTDDGVEEALKMLMSDGVDLRNKRTKLVQNTDGRVVELRVHSGRSACRLLYVQVAPGAIEVVRVTRTSQEAGAAFDTAVKQAYQAALAAD